MLVTDYTPEPEEILLLSNEPDCTKENTKLLDETMDAITIKQKLELGCINFVRREVLRILKDYSNTPVDADIIREWIYHFLPKNIKVREVFKSRAPNVVREGPDYKSLAAGAGREE